MVQHRLHAQPVTSLALPVTALASIRPHEGLVVVKRIFIQFYISILFHSTFHIETDFHNSELQLAYESVII